MDRSCQWVPVKKAGVQKSIEFSLAALVMVSGKGAELHMHSLDMTRTSSFELLAESTYCALSLG